jgi:hypothetical protein
MRGIREALRFLVFALAGAPLLACGKSDPGPPGLEVDAYCPGPGCEDPGDGILRVGAARRDINPTLIETEWDDVNENNHYDAGEDFVDVNGNGEFDAVWIGGFSTGRPATGIHDDLWVRALVLELGDTRVAIAVLDLVGWFANEIDVTRELLDPALGVDHLIVAATHSHQGPDTLGLWGERPLKSGVDPDYNALVRRRTAEAVAEAAAALEPVALTVARTETLDEDGSPIPFVGDNRDPKILDPTLTVLQFTAADDPDRTVASLVHWASHPEYAGSRNNLLSADYVYWLREGIENGVAEHAALGLPAIDGAGGEVVFVNGAFGGQIGPNQARPPGEDGEPIAQSGMPKAEAVGWALARRALEAMTSAADTLDVEAPHLAFRTAPIDVTVENTYYHVGGLVGVFHRDFYGYDEERAIGPGNYPLIASRVTYLEIGPIGIITAPGELHPELFLGGYDGSWSFGYEIVDPNNPNPPDLAQAPGPPYLRDLILARDGVEIALVFGAAEDFLGYIIPAWNFVLDENGPYITRAEGHHYEETNSVGPLVEEEVVGALRELIDWGSLSTSQAPGIK